MSHPHTCRICSRADAMESVYSFGPQPVAGYLEATEEAARGAPRLQLELVMCTRCGFLQQGSDAAQSLLVERVYAQYQPTYSMSSTVSAYVEGFVGHALAQATAGQGDLAVEIGSNDGGLLTLLNARGMRALGIEPSQDLCIAARARGLTVENTYFGEVAAHGIGERHGKAKLIITRHTLEHAFEPLDFLRGISDLLADDGLAVIEVPYVGLQMQNNQFQSMTFQHISHFSLTSLTCALRESGLTLINARFVEMDGGSVVAFAVKDKCSTASFVADGIALERTLNLDQPRGYAPYFDSVSRTCMAAHTHIDELIGRGAAIAGYGAGSKGQALLNMLSLDAPLVKFVIDDTPGYAGHFIPGTGITVVASNDPMTAQCDVVLVTAPTHVKEIVAKEQTRLGRHARFLTTTPSLHYATEAFAPWRPSNS